VVAVLAVLGASAPAAQASLSVPSTTYNSLTAFEAAAGGADDGTTPGGQGSGFRHFTPAGIAVDGSDPGSTAIPGGDTAALSPSRLQPWGIGLGPDVAVTNHGFHSVNPQAAFGLSDLWAPFNSNSTTLRIVAPAAQASTPVPAMTRGVGITFVNVDNGGTKIQYYSGDGLLDTVLVPQGATSFAGVLFRDPVVTSVVVTLGTAQIFDFDGTTVTPVGSSSSIAAGDDLVLAEPGAGEPTTAAAVGVPVSPPLASFDSTDPAGDITATIDWGDGSRSSGAIVPAAGGGFAVSASHAYPTPGSYTATVTVQDFSGSELMTQSVIDVAPTTQPVTSVGPHATVTSVACSPTDVAVSATAVCTATVQDTSTAATVPTGLVTFTTPTPGASFPGAGSCLLGGRGTSVAFCQVQVRPGQRPPIQARITASYAGDGAHAGSTSDTTIGVHAPSCSLQALSRRLSSGKFALIVTCDARINVQVVAQARATRKGKHKAFALRFGSLRSQVTAGRPTVLVVTPAPGVLPALRAAAHRQQRVSLKLTLTAGSGATGKTTTTRVSALRLS
jgi:PKD domain